MLHDNQVLDIFRNLPEHRGCTPDQLQSVENNLGVLFPQFYNEMMLLDAARLASARIVAPLNQLQELRREAMSILVEDGHALRLTPQDVVFAWNDIFAFYFFKADGTVDPTVMMFNYYNSDNDWKAVVAFETLSAFFANAIRHYLKLGEHSQDASGSRGFPLPTSKP